MEFTKNCPDITIFTVFLQKNTFLFLFLQKLKSLQYPFFGLKVKPKMTEQKSCCILLVINIMLLWLQTWNQADQCPNL